MSTLPARLSQLEQGFSRLVAAGEPRVSDLLRAARARTMAGEVAPPIFHDVENLEHQAQGRGLRADMARAQLRMLRPASEPMLPVRGALKEAAAGADGHSSALQAPTRATGSPATLAGTSVSDALVARIDALLMQASAHG